MLIVITLLYVVVHAQRAGVQAFPLYTRTMMMFGTADRMATTALRAIVLNIMRGAYSCKCCALDVSADIFSSCSELIDC